MFHHHSTARGSLSFSSLTIRAQLFQIFAVVAVTSIAICLIHNAINNLNNSSIISGFSFLDRSTEFGIVQHLTDYEQGDAYGCVLVVGLLDTLLVSALYIIFASALGFFLGLTCLSDNRLLRKLSTICIEMFRSIPPLLRIPFQYFAVLHNLPGPRQAVNMLDLMFLSNRGFCIPAPQMGEGLFVFCITVVIALIVTIGLFCFNKIHQTRTGQLRRTWPTALTLIVLLPITSQRMLGAALRWDIPAFHGSNFRDGMILIPELAALTLTLSVYTSVFIVEIIRAGTQAVSHDQHEAAHSLGLPDPVTLHRAAIPQALRAIIPPLISQYLDIVKNSSLATAIGYPGMVSLFTDTTLSQTKQAIETIVITMSIYLIISPSISLLINIHNRCTTLTRC